MVALKRQLSPATQEHMLQNNSCSFQHPIQPHFTAFKTIIRAKCQHEPTRKL